MKTLLPTTLGLVISAARGEFSDLQKKKIEETVEAAVASAEKALTDALPDALDPAAHAVAQAASAVLPQAVAVAERFVCVTCLPGISGLFSRGSATRPEQHVAPQPPTAAAPPSKAQDTQLQIRQPESADQSPQNASS